MPSTFLLSETESETSTAIRNESMLTMYCTQSNYSLFFDGCVAFIGRCGFWGEEATRA